MLNYYFTDWFCHFTESGFKRGLRNFLKTRIEIQKES